MNNPNNCTTCEYKQHPDGGHCYMFKDAPSEKCHQYKMSVEYQRMKSRAITRAG